MPPNRTRLEPVRVAPETFVIRALHRLDSQGDRHPHDRGEVMAINAMVIRGVQPIVVDTGARSDRSAYLDDLFALVEPRDVRWLVLSHDDADHAGNLDAVLDACPNAVLVTTWMATQRLSAAGFDLPRRRCRWLADDDVFDAGDRALTLVRPPLYDAPTTRGLLDTSTGVYWAADCFASLLPETEALVTEASETPVDLWSDGFVRFHQWTSPWIETVDPGWWQRAITRFEAHSLHAVASAHGPVLGKHRLPLAMELLRELPAMATVPQPGQNLLHHLLSSIPPEAV